VNRQSTPGVATLSRSDVEAILRTAPYVRVAEVASHIVGYLIGYLAPSQYGGEEFAWFQDRYRHFFYIDQVAVTARCRGRGIGAQLYQDVEQFASRRQLPLLTCEVHLYPPNSGSFRFHIRWGYQRVHEMETADGRQVVLMVKRIRPS
jgi:predicted GNAT superfamily acetyltransferase